MVWQAPAVDAASRLMAAHAAHEARGSQPGRASLSKQKRHPSQKRLVAGESAVKPSRRSPGKEKSKPRSPDRGRTSNREADGSRLKSSSRRHKNTEPPEPQKADMEC